MLFINQCEVCISFWIIPDTVYPKKYAHGFVVLCFVVVMQSFIMNSHKVFIHIHQGCFAGTGAIVRLPQCQWSKPDGYGKISQCITTTKHSKAKTVCIFLGIYCMFLMPSRKYMLVPVVPIHYHSCYRHDYVMSKTDHCTNRPPQKPHATTVYVTPFWVYDFLVLM